MNKSVKHIHFYTKKIAQQGAVHPTNRNELWYKRTSRLKTYKNAMHAAFERMTFYGIIS